MTRALGEVDDDRPPDRPSQPLRRICDFYTASPVTPRVLHAGSSDNAGLYTAIKS